MGQGIMHILPVKAFKVTTHHWFQISERIYVPARILEAKIDQLLLLSTNIEIWNKHSMNADSTVCYHLYSIFYIISSSAIVLILWWFLNKWVTCKGFQRCIVGEAGKGKGGQILYSSDLNIRTVGHEHLWNGQKKIEAGEACEIFCNQRSQPVSCETSWNLQGNWSQVNRRTTVFNYL